METDMSLAGQEMQINSKTILGVYFLELVIRKIVRRGGSNEYPQSVFLSRNMKNNVYPCKPQFYYIKMGFKGGQNYIGMHLWCMLTSKSISIRGIQETIGQVCGQRISKQSICRCLWKNVTQNNTGRSLIPSCQPVLQWLHSPIYLSYYSNKTGNMRTAMD